MEGRLLPAQDYHVVAVVPRVLTVEDVVIVLAQASAAVGCGTSPRRGGTSPPSSTV